jgi:hypothetical protein
MLSSTIIKKPHNISIFIRNNASLNWDLGPWFIFCIIIPRTKVHSELQPSSIKTNLCSAWGILLYLYTGVGKNGLASFSLVHFFCTKLEVEIRIVKWWTTPTNRFPLVLVLYTPICTYMLSVFLHFVIFILHTSYNIPLFNIFFHPVAFGQ